MSTSFSRSMALRVSVRPSEIRFRAVLLHLLGVNHGRVGLRVVRALPGRLARGLPVLRLRFSRVDRLLRRVPVRRGSRRLSWGVVRNRGGALSFGLELFGSCGHADGRATRVPALSREHPAVRAHDVGLGGYRNRRRRDTNAPVCKVCVKASLRESSAGERLERQRHVGPRPCRAATPCGARRSRA